MLNVKCRVLMPNKSEVIFQVDTGSSVNVLPERYHPPNLPLNPAKKILFAWNEGKVTALGTYRHSRRDPLNSRKYSIEFVIMKEDFKNILSLRASQALNFITFPDDEFERVSALCLDDRKEYLTQPLEPFLVSILYSSITLSNLWLCLIIEYRCKSDQS